MADESGSGSGYLRGVLAGLLLATATALLLASKPGGQWRQDLADGASKLKNKASDLGGNVIEAAQDLKTRGGELVAQARSEGNEALEAGTHYAQDAQENVQSQTPDVAAEGRDKAHDVVESV